MSVAIIRRISVYTGVSGPADFTAHGFLEFSGSATLSATGAPPRYPMFLVW